MFRYKINYVNALLYNFILLTDDNVDCINNTSNVVYKEVFQDVWTTVVHLCHTPIFDLRCRWHVSFDPTFIRNLTWSISDVSVKIRQRGILKYLIFVPSRALFSLFLLLIISIFYLIFKLTPINFNFAFKTKSFFFSLVSYFAIS